MANLVRPEFGPTLPQLLAPRLRALPRAGRLVLGAVILAVAAAIIAALAGSGAGQKTAVVRGPISFNLVYSSALHRAAPRAGELFRLVTRHGPRQTYTVRPLHLAPYQGDAAGVLPVLADHLTTAMRENDPGFAWRGEGRARINLLPGYQVLFQTRLDGHVAYGKRFLLLPDQPGARDGVDITLLSTRSLAIPNVDAVGNNGVLKAPLRSFRFGTQRP